MSSDPDSDTIGNTAHLSALFPLIPSERAYLSTAKNLEFHDLLAESISSTIWRCIRHIRSDRCYHIKHKPRTLTCEIGQFDGLANTDIPEALQIMLSDVDLFSGLHHKNVVDLEYVLR